LPLLLWGRKSWRRISHQEWLTTSRVRPRHRASAASKPLSWMVRPSMRRTIALTRPFSIFALMFFSDRVAGFRELHRVTRPKGLSVVASWSSMERLRFAQAILGTLREAVPDLPTPTKPPPWLSLADRGAFKAEMHSGGFPQVNMFSVTHLWTFASPEALFEALPSLSPAFSGILGSLQSDQREAFRTAFVRRIRADQGDGPFGLEGEAHIAVGIK
jgi:hypothetical protein